MSVRDLLKELIASTDVEIWTVNAAGMCALMRCGTAKDLLRDKDVCGREVLEIVPKAHRKTKCVEIYVEASV